MDKFVIHGGKPLVGEVRISGAKNAALPILAACLLSADPCHISNVPVLRDIHSMRQVLTGMGAACDSGRGGGLTVCAKSLNTTAAPYEVVRTMRASVLVLGPLLARFGRASVALPGGCAIGARPVDEHLAGLIKMGAEVRVENGNIEASCKRLCGARIMLTKPSVTGTENLMMAAVLADGDSVIENAAREPEIVDLADFLIKMGANIEGAGSGKIAVGGVPTLAGAMHRVMPDRIEAGTYIAAVAAAGGNMLLRHAREEDMRAITDVFAAGGVRIKSEANGLRITMRGRFRAVDAETAPHPGFPTDMQAQLVAANCAADGRAAVTETVFENRFMHVQELARMGAHIELKHNTALSTGVATLTGAPVMATDLRASASLVVAALAAAGKTTINRIYHLDRGYEAMEKKLRRLGANVRRFS